MKSILLGIAAAGLLSAGGFFLTLGDPSAQSDPLAKGAFVVVRPDGCHNPGKAAVTATAEGIVNGHRRTIPLRLTPLREAATYAILPAWPSEGEWVIHVTARQDDRETHSLIPVGRNGFERSKVKARMGPFQQEDLLALLK